MILNEYVVEFVKTYPRYFIRLLSLWYTFSNDELLRYGFLLSWDRQGAIYNPHIKWNRYLLFHFSNFLFKEERIMDCKKENNLIFRHLLKEEYYKTISEQMRSKIDNERLIKMIEKNKSKINKILWKQIARAYPYEIDDNFLKKFLAYIPIDDLLLNENINWSKKETLILLAHEWKIAINYNLWNQVFKPYINYLTLPKYLEVLNQLEKKAKIIMRSEERANSVYKYLVNIYVEQQSNYQVIASGYFYSTKNFELNKLYKINKPVSFLIETGQTFKN